MSGLDSIPLEAFKLFKIPFQASNEAIRKPNIDRTLVDFRRYISYSLYIVKALYLVINNRRGLADLKLS